MKVLALLGLVAALATACGNDDALNRSSDTTVIENERTIGDAAVYERIASSRSCTMLQEEFDIAMDNAEAREYGDPLRDISLSYANAADNRLREVGCYG